MWLGWREGVRVWLLPPDLDWSGGRALRGPGAPDIIAGLPEEQRWRDQLDKLFNRFSPNYRLVGEKTQGKN